MANDTQITLVGNATGVELRFTPSGTAVANFRLASQPRHFDRAKSEWVDGETLWLACSVFGQQAENLVEAVGSEKSMRVIVQGKLKSRSYETREGGRRTVYECDVEEVGASLRFATVSVQRTEQRASDAARQQPQHRAQPDPWAQPNDYDAPPF